MAVFQSACSFGQRPALPAVRCRHRSIRHLQPAAAVPPLHQNRGQRKQDSQPDVTPSQPAWVSLLAAATLNLAGFGLAVESFVPQPAQAMLNLPNVQIPRSVDSALRRSIPAFNPTAADVQSNIEEIAYLLRIPQRKPWGKMAQNTANVARVLREERPALIAGVRPEQEEAANRLADSMEEGLRRVDQAISAKDPEKASERIAVVLKDISELEIMQAPGLPYSVSKPYSSLPRLEGRAVVELEVAKADGSSAFLDRKDGGRTQDRAKVRIVVDGYSAPVTAGNFVCNVKDGKYTDTKIEGNFPSLVMGTSAGRSIPLEILPAGEFEPQYRLPLDVQSGELPVLPLSIDGAVAMTHFSGNDGAVDADQFFIYKFDKSQAGLAALSFDEGTFGVFGYVTDGMDVIYGLQKGDVVKSVKLISGGDRLVVPSAPQEPPASGA